MIIRTPIRAPKANAIAEHFVRTARSECLDWLLILNRKHLERVLPVFIDHYNAHRPHRALNLAPPDASAAQANNRRAIRLHPSPRSTRRSTPRIPPRSMRTKFAHHTRVRSLLQQ